MDIKPNEIVIDSDSVISGSEEAVRKVSERIYWLTHNYLNKITTDKSGWSVLYKDPNDNRFWELTYPKGEMHGGGSARLSSLTEIDAVEKYKF